MLALPNPMLARQEPLPTGRGWRFEPKLDGFRCLTCTHGRFKARSRRGWDMTPLIPELAASLPSNVQLDGELVAWDEQGQPDFHRLCHRMLHGDAHVPVTYMVFDVLAVDGLRVIGLPYHERRSLLASLPIDTPRARVVASFDDGYALWQTVCDRGLEGVVAKRLRDPYRPRRPQLGQDEEPRFQEELAGVHRRPKPRAS